MRLYASVIGLATLGLLAPVAEAAATTISYQGRVSEVALPSEAPGIAVGDLVTFTATFDSALAVDVGATFYNIDADSGLPVAVPHLTAYSLADDPSATYTVTIGSGHTFTLGDDYTVGQDYGLGIGAFPLVVYSGGTLLGLDAGATDASGLQFDIDPLAFLLHYRPTVGSGYGDAGATDESFRVTTDLDDAIRAAAIPAVPEPSSWALMTLGLGFAIGAAKRRSPFVPGR